MPVFPIKLNLKVFEYAGDRYVFDFKNFNVFMISELFYQILQLVTFYTREEVLANLSQPTGPFASEAVQAELADLEHAILQRSLSYQSSEGIAESADTRDRIPEELVVLKVEDFADLQLIHQLNCEDKYLLIEMDSANLDVDGNILAVSDMLAERSGRYRVNLQAHDGNFVNLYQKARARKLTNFDLRFHQHSCGIGEWTDQQLSEIKHLLLETISTKEGPHLAVIKDVLRVLGFQLGGQCSCPSDCWCRWLCGSVLGEKEGAMCKLYQVYFEVGILHYIVYLHQNIKLLRFIMSQDLRGKYTAQEKGILGKAYFWQNNFAADNFQALQSFRQQADQKLLTYKYCQGVI